MQDSENIPRPERAAVRTVSVRMPDALWEVIATLAVKRRTSIQQLFIEAVCAQENLELANYTEDAA